jgi:hypothetical protein
VKRVTERGGRVHKHGPVCRPAPRLAAAPILQVSLAVPFAIAGARLHVDGTASYTRRAVTGLVLKAVGISLAVLVVGVIGIVVFTDVWAQVGIGAAILVICAPLLIWAWNMDRKEKARRQGLEDI